MDTQMIDESIYERIYSEKKDLVFRTALRYLNNDEGAAEEVMQDVFLTLYNHMDMCTVDYLEAWLLVLAKNAALNRVEKAERETPDENITLTMDLNVSYKSIEEELEEHEAEEKREETRNKIFDEMYKKSPRWYEAMTLTYCLGKKRQDVAKEMEISLVALDGVLYRATKWAKKKFGADKEEP